MANVTRARAETPFTTVEAMDVPMSLFDLSHDWKGTFSMGQLIPFCTIETLPNDTFNIGADCFMRFAPQYFPVLHRVNATIDYFYVPNRILWIGTNRNGWEDFIAEADPDSPVTWANFALDEAIWNDVETAWSARILAQTGLATAAGAEATTILDYMGLRQPPTLGATATGGNNDVTINALPIAAYWKIWNDYYRRPQIQNEILPQSGSMLATGDNAPAWDTAFTNEGLDAAEWLLPVHRNWNLDFFTSAIPTPEAGTEVIIPVFNQDALTGTSGVGASDAWDTSTAALWSGGASNTVANTGGEVRTASTIPLAIDVSPTAGTIKQFRLAARTQEFLEKLERVGNRYRDVLAGFFGSDPLAGVIDYAEFLGRTESVVNISEVMSMSEQSGSPVGDYAGRMIGGMTTNQVSYACKEHGFIIGLISVMPRTSYMKSTSKFWFKDDRYDYAWTQFVGIGDQEITNREVAHHWNYNSTPDYNTSTFGYTRRYNEYRYIHDITTGEFATDLPDWTFARDPDVADVALNDTFLKCYPRYTDIFQVAAGTHEIYAQIWNKVVVKRALPKFGVPSL